MLLDDISSTTALTSEDHVSGCPTSLYKEEHETQKASTRAWALGGSITREVTMFSKVYFAIYRLMTEGLRVGGKEWQNEQVHRLMESGVRDYPTYVAFDCVEEFLFVNQCSRFVFDDSEWMFTAVPPNM